MTSIIVDKDHLPALTWASKAVKVTDRQPLDGVYAILRGDDVVWVGTTHWHLLGGAVGREGPLTGLSGPSHKLGHMKVPDPDGGKAFPSEVDDLKSILKDGGRVEIELEIPPDDQITAMLDRLYRILLWPTEDAITLPGARDSIWKDEDGKPVDYLVRTLRDGGRRMFGSEHVVPFKGKTLHRLNGTTWGLHEKGMFGMIAERAYVAPPKVEPTPQAQTPWAQ